MALLDFPQVRVSDGEWHHILVELKSGKDGKDIKYMALVSMDYGMFQVCTDQFSGVEGVGHLSSPEYIADYLANRLSWVTPK